MKKFVAFVTVMSIGAAVWAAGEAVLNVPAPAKVTAATNIQSTTSSGNSCVISAPAAEKVTASTNIQVTTPASK